MINKKRKNQLRSPFNRHLKGNYSHEPCGEELIHSREIFSDIIKHLPDATFVINSDGAVVAWNQAMEELTDVKAEYIMGKDDYEYSIPFYGERRPILIDQVFKLDSQLARTYQKFKSKEEAITAEVFIPKLRGKSTYLWGKAAPLYNRRREIVGAIESIRDISDMKQAEVEINKYQDHLEELVEKRTSELRNSEKKLKDIIYGSPIPTFIIDRNHRVIYWNQALEEFTEIMAEEIIGTKDHYRIFYSNKRPCLADLLVEDGIEDIEYWYSGNYQRSKLIEGAYHVTDFFPLLGKDGKWLTSTTAVIRDAKDDIIGAMTVIEDITQRRLAEEALQKSESKYRTIFENTGTATVLIQEDTTLSLVNSEFVRLTGFSREEAQGKSWLEFVSEDDKDRMIKYHLLRTMDSKIPPQNYEFSFLRKNGTFGDGYMTIETIPGTSQRVASIVDITDRKKSEKELKKLNEKLRKSNVELEQFASIAAHDLHEPLRMVVSFLKLLKQHNQDKLDPKAQKFIEYASEGAVRMQQMINELLTYSRLSTRKKELRDVDCQKILDQVLMNLKLSIKDSKAKITIDPLPILTADYSQLLQLFQNLIGNAIKYCGQDKPEIHISARKMGEEWLFTVEDKGIGIDPKYAQRIFMIFQRLHQAEYPGTGMGLAICKKIVERHGGWMWVDSKLGEGSKFYFTIPVKSVPKIFI